MNTSVCWIPLAENKIFYVEPPCVTLVNINPPLGQHLEVYKQTSSTPPPLTLEMSPQLPWSEYSCSGLKVIIPIVWIYQSIATRNPNIGVYYCEYTTRWRDVAQWLECADLRLSLPAARVQSLLAAFFNKYIMFLPSQRWDMSPGVETNFSEHWSTGPPLHRFWWSCQTFGSHRKIKSKQCDLCKHFL